MLGRCVTGQGSNDDVSNLSEIYTEWANYYLERAKSKRKVVDLSADCRDGLLLAEVIESVTTFKVPDLIKKPKSQQQMFVNVEKCLQILNDNNVGGLESITANDICSGRLKAVLSLFFSLSRYKQASKLKTPTKTQQTQQHNPQIHQQPVQHLNISQNDMTKERQLPVPYGKATNGATTAIPLPATVLVTRRSGTDKRQLPVPNGGQSGLVKYPSGTPSSESSRPNSPPGVSVRFQSTNCKIPQSPYNIGSNGSLVNVENIQPQQQQPSNGAPTKHSMLDKLKLFNKDRSDRSKSHTSKRTSSSSGFSSARSDSSLSLNNDNNIQAPSKVKKPDAASSVKLSTKTSKLLSTKPTKEGSGLPAPIIKTSSKSDKKDKKLAEPQMPESSMLPPKVQKMQTVKFQQPLTQQQQQQLMVSQNDLRIKQQQQQHQQSQMGRKIEIRTEPKTGIQQPKSLIQTNSTLPKPVAAIKGQTKQIDVKRDEHDIIKIDKTNGNQHISSISLNNNSEQKLQIVNPLSMSPLHNQLLNQNGNNISSQSMTDSVHSASTNNHSNSSESSVIYRPSASESGSEFYHSNVPMQRRNPNPIPNRKLDHFNDPLQTNGHKFNTIPSKLNGHCVNNQMATTIFEEDKQHGASSSIAMRPMIRGYNNHVTLPTRGSRGGQNLVNGYYEENGQGYCSDGDALRKTPIRYTDIENGYLSEGGAHFMSIFRNRPQMPSTITEERYKNSKEGNLESPDMESSVWSNNQDGMKTSSPGQSRRNGSSKSRVKGVPQTFGYIKRSNGTSTAADISTNSLMNGRTTAHVSAVPRSGKVKVSGGTQTGNDSSNIQYKSYSLTGAGATQLSQSVKERFATGTHSLPKPSLDMHGFHARMSNRGSARMNDGSLSDTYTDIKDCSSYSIWLKHSNTSNRLSDGGDSNESVSILARNQRFIQHRNSAQLPGLKLNRSNSIRSTKSEKMYPSMLSRGPEIETEPYYCLPVSAQQQSIPWSQPTSPTPRGVSALLSPTHRLAYSKKNDEVNGSQLSLMSGASSMYGSTTEEQRQANEVTRLKRELTKAREQVMSLSSQLSTNAHVVNAFEKSLATMTNRLQTLTATTEKKESEITEMRQTIELLKKQSIQAGLTSAHIQSMGKQVNGNGTPNGSPTKKSLNGSHDNGLHNGNGAMHRHHSTDSVCSINSLSSSCSTQDKKKKKGWLRSSFTKAFSRNAKISKTGRQMSLNGNLSESKSSLPPPTPIKLPPKMPSNHALLDFGKPPISPTKSPQRQITVVVENAKPIDSLETEGHPVVEDLKKQLREKDMVLTDIRLEALTQASQMETLKETVKAMRQEMMALKQNNERLQKMVTSRSLGGSENSLNCPASPLGSCGDSRRYSFATDSGHSRPPLDLPQNLDETEEEDNVPEPAPAPQSPNRILELSSSLERISLSNEILTTPAEEVADPIDGKRIAISVFLGQPESFLRFSDDQLNYYNEDDDSLQFTRSNSIFNEFNDSHDDSNSSETVVAFTYISGKTTWQNLDYIVRKTFKDYLSKIDSGTNLGLNTDSITSYHLGEAKRGPEMGFPELLPCGYIIGNVKSLYICLQGVGSLAFETLIPRSIVHRYINLLTEHRRLILCGPSGTGKSHLARKLAEFLVAKSNRSPAESIATFNVDHNSKDLQQYLGTIAEQATIKGSAEELPLVIILDNLHHASALGDVFSCLLSAGPATKLPCIIGTMSQATCNTTNLQLHHNFRWVLTANHMEPVKGFLGRYLRRRLFDLELQTGNSQTQLEKIFKWLPTVLHHINSFLETHSSSDVTIGPQLFLECPLDVTESQKWFVDLWNDHLAPYLVDAIKEGVQLYGRRGNAWIDPCQYVRETYPWPITPTSVPKLRTITADDVGLEAESSGNKEDPLLNMLNQLKEAASWNEVNHDDSDCVSLDSNFTHDSSIAET